MTRHCAYAISHICCGNTQQSQRDMTTAFRRGSSYRGLALSIRAAMKPAICLQFDESLVLQHDWLR